MLVAYKLSFTSEKGEEKIMGNVIIQIMKEKLKAKKAFIYCVNALLMPDFTELWPLLCVDTKTHYLIIEWEI